MSEPVQHLLLPYLAKLDLFPYFSILKCCDDQLMRQEQQHIIIDQDCPMDGRDQPQRNLQHKQPPIKLSSFLLYSILKLDEKHVAKLKGDSMVAYVHLIAHMIPNIWKLPRKSIVITQSDDSYVSSDEEDDDNGDRSSRKKDAVCILTSDVEKKVLLEIVAMLNDRHRTDALMSNVLLNLERDQFVKSLCQICHVLMVFNRSAVYEYKLVYTLAFKPVFIRTVWHTISTMKSPQSNNFNCPLSLLSKGISVRK